MTNKPKNLAMLFPFKGYDVGTSLSPVGQPSLTTSVCLNVWPYDYNGRACGAVRPGTARAFTGDAAENFTLVRLMVQGTVADYVTATRASLLVVVDSAGNIWQKTDTAAFDTIIAAGDYDVLNGGTPSGALHTDDRGELVSIGGIYNIRKINVGYFVDGGTTIRVLKRNYPDVGHGSAFYSAQKLIATAGTFPTGCTAITFWRNRMLIFGDPTLPGTLYAMKVGDPTNADFAADLDAAPSNAAWAVNVTQAGQVADVLTAVAAFSDDTLLVWGTRTLYRLDGDPAAGGSVSLVSLASGAYHRSSWCFDGVGTVYWVGQDGFFSYGAGGIKNLSQSRLGSYWREMTALNVELRFDKRHRGVWIFDCRQSGTTVPKHLFYSIEFDGFFPMKFPSNTGPACSLWYDNPVTPSLSCVLLGGISGSGYIRQINQTGAGVNDNATSTTVGITSDVLLGPVEPYGDMSRAKVVDLQAVLGDSRILQYFETVSNQADGVVNISYSLIGGADPVAVLSLAAANVTQTGTFSTWGRQHPRNHRLAANAFGVRLQNSTDGKTWSIERVVLHTLPAGKNR